MHCRRLLRLKMGFMLTMLILNGCNISIFPQSVFIKELTFTSKHQRQIMEFRVDQPGEYSVVLKNDNPAWAGYWIVWDYISLKEGNVPIWEIGKDDGTFSEFCDQQAEGVHPLTCKTDFRVGQTEVSDFIKTLNDGDYPEATINFTLGEQYVNTDLMLVLGVRDAIHDHEGHFIDHFDMKVILKR